MVDYLIWFDDIILNVINIKQITKNGYKMHYANRLITDIQTGITFCFYNDKNGVIIYLEDEIIVKGCDYDY
jgi:hypothetical protein